jgi:hypothetical protein
MFNVLAGQYWWSSGNGEEEGEEGLEVMFHDLSSSAVAAALVATPLVPATGTICSWESWRGCTSSRSRP